MEIINTVCFLSVLAACRAMTTTTTTAPMSTTASAACPTTIAAGHLTTTYSGSCYEIVNDYQSFDHAEADCRKRHGHLITIDNAEEQDYINQYLVSNFNQDVWIGLGDHRHEEHFTWTSGAPVSYTNWNPNRKDTLLHGIEDCVVIQPGNQGLWEDMGCGSLLGKHAYICEYRHPAARYRGCVVIQPSKQGYMYWDDKNCDSLLGKHVYI